MKYRKKPVIIDAVQFNGNLWDEELQTLIKTQNRVVSQHNDKLKIDTLEGEMIANKGDWIIKGVKNELYPCKPDIFEQTYEKV